MVYGCKILSSFSGYVFVKKRILRRDYCFKYCGKNIFFDLIYKMQANYGLVEKKPQRWFFRCGEVHLCGFVGMTSECCFVFTLKKSVGKELFNKRHFHFHFACCKFENQFSIGEFGYGNATNFACVAFGGEGLAVGRDVPIAFFAFAHHVGFVFTFGKNIG